MIAKSEYLNMEREAMEIQRLNALLAQPTPSAADMAKFEETAAKLGLINKGSELRSLMLGKPTERLEKTAPNILGPFYRGTAHAPFRAISTPPGAAGVPALIKGVGYGYDIQAPLAGVDMHEWHADDQGHYSDEEEGTPLNIDSFINRVRMKTDEAGYYEMRTIIPAPYQIGVDPKTGKPIYRTIHWHLAAFLPGYALLVTQKYKKGEELNKTDKWYLPSLEIDFKPVTTRSGFTYLEGRFDFVLDRALK